MRSATKKLILKIEIAVYCLERVNKQFYLEDNNNINQ